MAAIKTIAIVTEHEGMARNLVNKLSTEHFRIIFVTENARKFKSVAAEIAERVKRRKLRL